MAGVGRRVPGEAARLDAGCGGHADAGRDSRRRSDHHFAARSPGCGGQRGSPQPGGCPGHQLTPARVTPDPVRIVGQVFDTNNNGVEIITSWSTLSSADPSLAPSQYNISLRPGTNSTAYAQALGSRLGQAYFVQANARNSTTLTLMQGLIGTLTLMLAVVAGLGVLNTVVLSTRERVHDLGVFKAVGMTPRQTITMVVCWVAGTGLIAGLIAVPAGDVLHRYVLPAMANAAGTGLPPVIINAYSGWELGLLAQSGLAIAVVGALLPASWAAGTRTATALHAE